MSFQQFNATIFDLVSSKKNQKHSKLGQVRRNVGRWNQQVENRQRGLHRAGTVLRLFHLCRSIDLARALRSQSKLADKQYWLLKRKGAKRPGWEALLSLPFPSVSPVHLLNKYVALTASQGKGGGPVFLAVTPPFAPLTANSIGRITKNILLQMGIPVTIFGAHSTRGAAVKMYKSLGLTSEVVCELGCWKNAEAFSKHYLRVGAVETANTIITNFLVHKVPSWRSAEKGGSSSPGMNPDPGRMDLTCEAQSQDGPDPPTQEEKRASQEVSGRVPGGGCLRWSSPMQVLRSSRLPPLKQ